MRSLPLAFSFLLPVIVLATPVPAQEGGDKPDARAAAEAAWNRQNWQQAAANYRKVVTDNDKDGQAWHRLGYALHAQGELDEALAAHQRTAEFPAFAAVGSYNVACVYALRGDNDNAIAWLQKAVQKGFADAGQLAGDGDMDGLRDDPRFVAIVEKLGKQPANKGLQAFPQTTERQRSRIAWFGKSGGAGQVSVEHAALPWREKFEKAIGSPQVLGKKWRLGANFWTSLDSSVPLTLAGVDVPAGYYYLTLEQRDEKTFVLALHDAAEVRKQKLDAFQAEQLKGGIEVQMRHERVGDVAERLAITLDVDKGDNSRGELRIAFGPHVLVAAVAAGL